jgi:hypothetical protein
MHQNRGIIETILDEKETELGELKDSIHQFHQDALSVLQKYVEGSSSSTTTLRDRYTSISDQNKLNGEITGVSAGNSRREVGVGTKNGEITVEFHDVEYAASMAIAAWLSAGFGDTVDDTLATQTVSTNFDVVESILYNKEFNNFRQTIEADYF